MVAFKDIEHIVSHMFESIDEDIENVSVITDRKMAIDILKEILTYDGIEISICDIEDEYGYDREYVVTITLDDDVYDIGLEKAYCYENDIYLGIDGYVLFHEDVNSKALVDLQNNEYVKPDIHDWFVIGEDGEECECDECCACCEKTPTTIETYYVNGKSVTKEEYDEYTKIVREYEEEMNAWRRAFWGW